VLASVFMINSIVLANMSTASDSASISNKIQQQEPVSSDKPTSSNDLPMAE